MAQAGVARVAPSEQGLLTLMPGVMGTQNTGDRVARAFSANQHRSYSLHALPHCLRRSCRAPGPALDLVPVMWLQTNPLQTQAGTCCQAVPSRRGILCQKQSLTTQSIALAYGLVQLRVRD